MLWQKIRSLFSKKEEVKSTPRPAKKNGFLKYFNRKRGFGFIRLKGSSEDVFVHVSEFQDYIKVGDPVRCEIEEVPKGLEAHKVELVSE